MFIIKPIPRIPDEEGSVGFGQWIKNRFTYLFIGNNKILYDEHVPRERFGLTEASDSPEPISLFKQALLMTYPPDGYDLRNHHITDSDGKTLPYDGRQSFWRLILSSFFGLPNRPMFYSNSKRKYHDLKLTIGHILLNFFGGWDFNDSTSTEKNIAQTLGIIVKISLIFPIKVLTLVPKIALNILKIFTELLPTYASFLCAYAYRQAFFNRRETKNIHLQRLNKLFMGGASFLHLIAKTLSLIGRALTSPKTSAMLAVAYAHEIKGTVFGIRTGTILGFIAAALSVMVSASLWAMIIPLAISAAFVYLPNLITAIAQTLGLISTLPVIAPTLSLLHGTISVIFTALSTIFAPIVIPLSNLLSIPVSAAMLAVGAGYGVFLTTIGTLGSAIADYLSNAWVCWHTGGPITGFLSDNNPGPPPPLPVTPGPNPTLPTVPTHHAKATEVPTIKIQPLQPKKKYKKLNEEREQSEEAANKAVRIVHSDLGKAGFEITMTRTRRTDKDDSKSYPTGSKDLEFQFK
jgi:hypothetical protein